MNENGIVRGFDRVEGRNPIVELLRSQRKIEKILCIKGLDPSGSKIIDEAKGKGIDVGYIDRHEMDSISQTGAHQGIIALVEKFQYAKGPEAIIQKACAKGQEPIAVVLDRINDPRNLGAIIRTAHCCGAHGIIIPKRNAAEITPAAVKSAAGAVEHMVVARVPNTVHTLEKMKDMGFWIAGADMDGEVMYDADLKGPIALVVGSEGKGLGRLVRERCDFLVSVPMKGVLSSLNVSVATGVLLYEVLRQREYQ